MVLALWLACSGPGGRPAPAGPSLAERVAGDPQATVEALDLTGVWADAVSKGLRLQGEPVVVGSGRGLASAELRCADCGCDPVPLGPVVEHGGKLWPQRRIQGVSNRVVVTPRPPDGTVWVERHVSDVERRPLALRWPDDWSVDATVDGALVQPVRAGGYLWFPPGGRIHLRGGGAPGEGQRVDVDAVVLDVDRWFDHDLPEMVLAMDTLPGHAPMLPAIQHLEGEEAALLVAYRAPDVAGREGVRVIVPRGEARAAQLLELVLVTRSLFPDFPQPIHVYGGPVDVAGGGRAVISAGQWSPRALESVMSRLWLDAADPALTEAVARWISGRHRDPVPTACLGSRHPSYAGEHRLLELEERWGRARVVKALATLRAREGASFEELEAALEGPME